MIQRIDNLIVEYLENELSTVNRKCTVVYANQTAPAPEYPYVSYTVITPVEMTNKGYCIDRFGNRYRETLQTWSLTVHSDDYNESYVLTQQMYDFFSTVGNAKMSDDSIVVSKVGGVTNRDNLLSIKYEYCSGFDVTFNLIDKIAVDKYRYDGTIDTVPIINGEKV